MLRQLIEWLYLHLATLTWGIITVLLSIYGQDVKKFLHSWPRTKATLRAQRAEKYASDLNLVKSLHPDAYKTILYICWNLADIPLHSLYAVILISILDWLIQGRLITSTEILIVCGGVVVGKAIIVKRITTYLYNYDKYAKLWENKLKELQSGESPSTST